jgi:hypothetical protein
VIKIDRKDSTRHQPLINEKQKKSLASVASQDWKQTMLYIVSNLSPVLVKKFTPQSWNPEPTGGPHSEHA